MNYTNYVHIYIHQNQYTAELLGKKKKKKCIHRCNFVLHPEIKISVDETIYYPEIIKLLFQI